MNMIRCPNNFGNNKQIYLRKIKIERDEFGRFCHCPNNCDYCDALMDEEEYNFDVFEAVDKALKKWKPLQKGLGFKNIFSYLRSEI